VLIITKSSKERAPLIVMVGGGTPARPPDIYSAQSFVWLGTGLRFCWGG
jgi:hypothetical protein